MINHSRYCTLLPKPKYVGCTGIIIIYFASVYLLKIFDDDKYNIKEILGKN